MTIQPIYGLFEKEEKQKDEDMPPQRLSTGADQRDSVGSHSTDSQSEATGDN